MIHCFFVAQDNRRRFTVAPNWTAAQGFTVHTLTPLEQKVPVSIPGAGGLFQEGCYNSFSSRVSAEVATVLGHSLIPELPQHDPVGL